MKRYAANILYCSPGNLLKNGVVEVNKNGIITGVFSLTEKGDEVHSTVFFNGILLSFNPFFNQEDFHFNVFQLLEQQFRKNNTQEIACHQKADLWLLQGDELFGKQILGTNWRVIPIKTTS